MFDEMAPEIKSRIGDSFEYFSTPEEYSVEEMTNFMIDKGWQIHARLDTCEFVFARPEARPPFYTFFKLDGNPNQKEQLVTAIDKCQKGGAIRALHIFRLDHPFFGKANGNPDFAVAAYVWKK